MLVAGFVPFGQAICLDGEIALGTKEGDPNNNNPCYEWPCDDITNEIAISLGVRDLCQRLRPNQHRLPSADPLPVWKAWQRQHLLQR